MKKKFLLALMLITLIIVALGTISASAETEGIYTYSVLNGNATVKGCDTSASGEITIPNTLGGCSVTGIGDYAFYGCSGLVSITIPNSVTSIGSCAFSKCSNLITMTIPNNVTNIGDATFSGCIKLVSVNIPNGITSLNGTFSGCTSLASVIIPDSVTTIGQSTFSNCRGLSSVKIPDNITSIGYEAFAGCNSLTSINIPQKVKGIGGNAFSGCDSLTRVDITDIESWCNIDFGGDDRLSNPLRYAENLYLDGDLLTDLVIPQGITKIKEKAFSYCNSITSVTISNSVTAIDKYAFYSCGNLKNVTIPNGVTTINEYAFGYCGNLESITIPDSVTSIGVSAFRECNSLLYAAIGKGIENIPEYAFGRPYYSNSSHLKYVALPAEVKYIQNDAFSGCPNITTVFYAGSESQWNEILFYNRNENLTSAKIVYNATKKTYNFETNCDIALNEVIDYAIFTMPTVENDGLTLVGWYDNKSLSGNPVTFPYYGDATTLYAAWTDRTGKSFEDAFVAKANQEYTVTTTESGQYIYFEFVPNLSKEYRFYTTGNLDTYGYLYDGYQSRLTSDDDGGDGNNFYISYKLTAGQTYYIAAKIYSGTGTFTLVTEEPVDYRINSVTVKDMSGNELSSIPNGTFLATVSFTNVSSSADTVIILAQYTDAGTFKGLMYIQTKDVPTGSTIKLSIPVDNSNGDVAKLKAFCWESFGSLTPMGNSASFPVE